MARAEVNLYALLFNEAAQQFHDLAGEKGFLGDAADDNYVCMKSMLICGEVAEFVDELRKTGDREHMVEELADVVIRTLGLAKELDLNIGQAIVDKHLKNKDRPYLHGKRF